jgi:ATP-binding cassette subfamily F protein 3
MISLDKISIVFSGKPLFEDVSLMINLRDRIGLVGRNGAGKTTLLRIIASLQEPSSGQVVAPGDLVIGYLPQQMKHTDKQTLWDEVKESFSEVLRIQEELDAIQRQLDNISDENGEDYTGQLQHFNELNERFVLLGGHTMEASIEQTLLGLGFLREEFHRHTREFSGGWRMRIELARILLKNPGLLLLDEPTNHLDIESIQWLENYLKNYPGAVIMISHDRVFLNTVTNRTVEISLGRIYDYNVSYSKFRQLRQERREQQLATYRNQQRKIEQTERFIERFRYKNTKASQVQSRIKMLDKMDPVEIELEDLNVFNVRFPVAPRSGTIVVEAVELSKSYGKNRVLDKVDLVIERGEKVAFVGKNGQGKTTMSQILAGELSYDGKLRIGHQVDIGYYAQNQDEIMDENKTVFATIDDEAVGEIRTQIRGLLGSFLFHGDDIYKKVKVLSGGERSRLAIARLLLKPYNLLILDEPTNHLDMRSKDILKNALMKYTGTLIVVSHDREFLDGLVGKVYEFRDGKIRENIGGIYDFLRRVERAKSTDAGKKEAGPADAGENKSKKNKLIYEKRKELDREIRKRERKVANSESKIAEIEAELKSLHERMNSGETIEDQSLFTRYNELSSSLESEMRNWERLSYELEILREK